MRGYGKDHPMPLQRPCREGLDGLPDAWCKRGRAGWACQWQVATRQPNK